MKPIQDLFALKASFAKLLRAQKLPFRITPQIERYLEDILYLHDKWLANNKDDVLYLIGCELKSEPALPDNKENNDRFWKYLEANRLAIALPHIWTNDDTFQLVESSLNVSMFPKDWRNNDDFWEHLDENLPIELSNIWAERVEKMVSNTSPSKLIAIAKTYAKEGPPIEKIFAKPEPRQENLEKVTQHAKEHKRTNRHTSPYRVVLVSEIELIRELYNHIKNKDREEGVKDENEDIKPSVQVIQDSKVRFDSLTGVIRYGDEMVKFHRGERSNKPRLALFRELWEFKKHIKNGKIKAKGESLPPETFAVRLNIISSAGDFQRNKQIQDRFFSLIKGINRELRNKKMPMEIERNNGVQLVITEK